MFRVRSVVTAISLSCAAVAPATAATIILGTGTSGNIAPFGRAITGNPNTDYQQIYNAAAFGTAPLLIDSLWFTMRTVGSVNGGNYTLSLSTTTTAVSALDPVYANNIGSNNTQIFSGALAGQVVGGNLVFNFAPFLYDPTAGNLLLNVNASGVTSGSATFLANGGDAAGAFSRVTNFVTVGTTNYGLMTTFQRAVPEPASWMLLLAGLAVVGGSLRHHRRLARHPVRVRFT